MATRVMEHFVTLFNLAWAPQGLALLTSLRSQMTRPFTLWIVCIDEATYQALNAMDLADVRLMSLAALESAELRAVKEGRTTGEYCWTITSFTPTWVFDADPSAERVTYVDADTWFRDDPVLALAEFEASGKAIQITRHAYAAEYDKSALTGIFCVQFMTFVRGRSDAVLRTWQQQCLEWCFDRFEDGRFGDQKYLDPWPGRYPDVVHVLREEQLIQGPWNATRFPYSSAVMYHFHGLKILGRHRVHLGPYPLPRPTLEHVYGPYLEDLRACLAQLAEAGMPPPQQAPNPSAYRLARMRAAFIVRHFGSLFGPMTMRF